jgi:6-phosphogluconolactonase
MSELHRYATAEDLTDGAARALLEALIVLQADGGVAELCLTGGRIANRVYERLGSMVEGSALDPGRLELWWGDELFVPTDDPARNAGRTLSLLAGRFPLDPARTHPMPSADGAVDNANSAASYAKELGDTRFDICLLGLGEDGHVAGIHPGHPSFEPTTHTVIAVNDAPKQPAQGISVSMETIRGSREVWFLVSGAEKAAALARAFADDPAVPGGVARGTSRTLWFVDADAATRINYYDCPF